MKKLYGVAINDVSPVHVNGRDIKSYKAWKAMIQRCYESRYFGRFDVYKDCYVSQDWLIFSNFKAFFDENYKTGYQLDKDILFTGNRVYSGERCVYVPREINSFVIDGGSHFRGCLIGSHFAKEKNKFMSYINISGKRKFLGYFDSEMDAHKAWFNKKLEIAKTFKTLCDEIHPRLFSGLMTKIRLMRKS
ncbi:hypothetical protein [Enterobacter chuandaensis]|uniref:hypothetical protein n=1 Tax=Enterobacter chuandaensis TaxID=2497875 RepID=UPI003FD2564E